MSLAQKNYDALLKIVFVGDTYAGKTSLLKRVTDNEFNQNYLATIGVDFRTKPYEINGRRIMAQFWDTAGQERFRSIQAPYYRGAHAVIICYNLNDIKSIQNLDFWLKECQTHNKNIPAILVGCKKDLEIQVPTDAILPFLEKKAMMHFETSAKTGQGVEEAVYSIIEDCSTRLLGIQRIERLPVAEKKQGFKEIMKRKTGCC